MNSLLPLEEAQAKLLALAPEMQDSKIEVSPWPMKRWLSKDHRAQRTQPAADLSAMDGYAMGAGDGPWQRIGESRAGTPFTGTLAPGECVRISTGAHMPQGTDRVLIQENAEVHGTVVSSDEAPPGGHHVRRAGFDFKEGESVLAKGTALTTTSKALAVAAGIKELTVKEPPRVALLDSGDELVKPGMSCGPTQIPASNGAMLAAMLHPYVGPAHMLGPVPDDPEALEHAIVEGEENQILITSGGASVGDHDLIRPTLERLGATIDFWKVAIKPGKPLMVATREVDWGRQIILGLPGNPVSSFVTAFLFALPLVRKAMGAPNPLPSSITVPAGEELPATGMRQEFLRGILGNGAVTLASSQDSSALRALAMANCLINRPAHTPEVSVGESVEVYLL